MKRKFGDRKDGVLLRDIDAMHIICPMLYPNRCDNEAFVSECIDLTKAKKYIKAKNAANPEFRYSLFHFIIAVMLKTITLRPNMNRFIANKNLYMRNVRSASFVVKKKMTDDSEEALAFIYADDNDNFDTIHEKIHKQIMECKSDKVDDSTAAMNVVSKLPRFLTKAVVAFCRFLDRHGKVPSSMIATDPYYSSVLLTNLGSIKLQSGYHHLTNWGTNSVFVIVGEKKMRPFYHDDGTYEMKDSIDFGLTVDERIADGFYFSRTIKLIKTLFNNPQLMDLPLSDPVEY